MRGRNVASGIERSWGYEVRRQGQRVVLTDRNLWGVAYAAAVLGGAGLVLAAGTLAALGTSRSVDVRTEVPALFGVSALLLAFGGFLYRGYRQRRDLPEDQVARRLIVDGADGVLRDGRGEVLARLDAVRTQVRTDFAWTSGVAQVVFLAWPGERRPVFRSTDRRAIASLLAALAEAGL